MRSGHPRRDDGIDGHLDEDRATSPEPAARYEPRDVPAFLPFWLGCLLGGFVGAILLAITLGFPLANHQQYRGPLSPLPGAPRLQLAPHSDLVRYRAAKRRELESSSSRSAETATIERAMRATASQGWGPPK
jgi:hypothetical protein